MITLSQHDEGRPQVLLEAMAAGLPIIASDISAHKNLIQHQHTGWIANSYDSFRQGMEWLSIPDNSASVGIAAKNWVKENVGTWRDCAAKYIQLYNSLLASL